MTAKSTVHNLPTKVLGPNRDLTHRRRTRGGQGAMPPPPPPPTFFFYTQGRRGEVQRFAAFLQRVVRKRRAHAQYGNDQIRHLPCNQAPL